MYRPTHRMLFGNVYVICNLLLRIAAWQDSSLGTVTRLGSVLNESDAVRSVRKIANATAGFVMPVPSSLCLPVRIEQLGIHLTDFLEIGYENFSNVCLPAYLLYTFMVLHVLLLLL